MCNFSNGVGIGVYEKVGAHKIETTWRRPECGATGAQQRARCGPFVTVLKPGDPLYPLV